MLSTILLPFLFLLVCAPLTADPTTFQQRLNSLLENVDGGILVVSAGTGQQLGCVHPELFYKTAQPPGSLIKPFTALSYYFDNTTHHFPEFRCPATLPNDPEGCWDRAGHGSVDIRKAIAFSCNVYFRQLSERVSPQTFARVLRNFGLIRDSAEIDGIPPPEIMVGRSIAWKVPPHRLLRAYAALFNGGLLWSSGDDPPGRAAVPAEMVELLRNGMMDGAAFGTSLSARRASGGLPLMGKTGTSLLMLRGSVDRRSTQGWWIGFYPARHPEIAVLSFVRKGRGALDAAPLGGKAVAAFRQSGAGTTP